jgi:hypothetical protein
MGFVVGGAHLTAQLQATFEGSVQGAVWGDARFKASADERGAVRLRMGLSRVIGAGYPRRCAARLVKWAFGRALRMVRAHTRPETMRYPGGADKCGFGAGGGGGGLTRMGGLSGR